MLLVREFFALEQKHTIRVYDDRVGVATSSHLTRNQLIEAKSVFLPDPTFYESVEMLEPTKPRGQWRKNRYSNPDSGRK